MRPHRLVTTTVFLYLLATAAFAQAPADQLTPLQVSVACAPLPTLAVPSGDRLRIVGSQDPEPRGLFGQPERLVVKGGTSHGLQIGQEYYVRRLVSNGRSARDVRPRAIVTAGWVRIAAINHTAAVATVEHLCGDILAGDYLEPFVAPSVSDDVLRLDTTGLPDFNAMGRVLYGDDERSTAAAGDFVLIDRGAEKGITAGERLAIYRDLKGDDVPLAAVGEATVVSVGPELALIRINASHGPVVNGDFVAPRKK